MRGIVGGQEQHRLRNVVGFTDTPERRSGADALLERFPGFHRRQGRTPEMMEAPSLICGAAACTVKNTAMTYLSSRTILPDS